MTGLEGPPLPTPAQARRLLKAHARREVLWSAKETVDAKTGHG